MKKISLLLGTVLLLLLNSSVLATQPVDGVHKAFVCKYVGTPNVDERLQTGQNPISVDFSAINEDPVVVGTYFADAQGRSFVLALDIGQDEDTLPPCPIPVNPTPTPVPTPTPTPNATPTPTPVTTPTPTPIPTPNPTPSPTPSPTPTPTPIPTPEVTPTPNLPTTDTDSSANVTPPIFTVAFVGLLVLLIGYIASEILRRRSKNT